MRALVTDEFCPLRQWFLAGFDDGKVFLVEPDGVLPPISVRTIKMIGDLQRFHISPKYQRGADLVTGIFAISGNGRETWITIL